MRNSMGLRHNLIHIVKLAVPVAFATLGLTACNEVQTARATDGISDGIVRKIAVSLEDVSSVELSNYTFVCKKSPSQTLQICVEICHRPPGNPKHSKTKTLPLQATLAHLEHGNNTHNEEDYLGPCSEDDSISDDVSEDASEVESGDDTVADSESDTAVDSGTETDTATDNNTTPEIITPEPELPLWCTENLAIDSNCDGLIDETGEPLY